MCYGSLAQLVEQRLEEPCVPSSSLGGATILFFAGQEVFDVFDGAHKLGWENNGTVFLA